MSNTPPIIDKLQHQIVLLQKGDLKALEFFFDKYSCMLMGIISRIIKDEYPRELALKNTFGRLWVERESLDFSILNITVTLITFAREAAVLVAESEKIASDTVSGKINSDFKAGKSGSFATSYVTQEEQVHACFELLFHEGLTRSEAARALGIKDSEFKANLRKSIKNLGDKTQS